MLAWRRAEDEPNTRQSRDPAGAPASVGSAACLSQMHILQALLEMHSANQALLDGLPARA